MDTSKVEKGMSIEEAINAIQTICNALKAQSRYGAANSTTVAAEAFRPGSQWEVDHRGDLVLRESLGDRQRYELELKETALSFMDLGLDPKAAWFAAKGREG